MSCESNNPFRESKSFYEELLRRESLTSRIPLKWGSSLFLRRHCLENLVMLRFYPCVTLTYCSKKRKDDEPSLKYLRTRGHTTDSYGSLPVVWNKAIHMIFIKRWKSCSLLQDIAERFDFPKGLSSKIQNSIMFFELQICRTVFTKNTRPWYSLKISRRQNVSNAWIPEFRSFQKILNKSGNNEHLIRKL